MASKLPSFHVYLPTSFYFSSERWLPPVSLSRVARSPQPASHLAAIPIGSEFATSSNLSYSVSLPASIISQRSIFNKPLDHHI